MYIEKSTLLVSLDSYCGICLTAACKRLWVTHLPNEELEDLENFVLVILMHI